MRTLASHRFHFVVLLLGAAWVLSASTPAARAQEVARSSDLGTVGSSGAAPATRPSQQVDARLHQSIRACGKKWIKRAKKLSSEQLGWMLQEHHGIYSIAIEGDTVLTIELLSTPSYRSCDVARTWSRRETSVRLTYTLDDGRSKVELVNFAKDDIFFDSAPKVYAHLGRALLRGVDIDGTQVSRWIDVEPLQAIYQAASRRAAAPQLALSLPADELLGPGGQ